MTAAATAPGAGKSEPAASGGDATGGFNQYAVIANAGNRGAASACDEHIASARGLDGAGGAGHIDAEIIRKATPAGAADRDVTAHAGERGTRGEKYAVCIAAVAP